MKVILPVLCFVLLFAQQVAAQQKLVPTEAVARTIDPGKTNSFSLSLNDGDYVSASLTQHGQV
ncbi:MAG TPA: hypothetical protein VIR01_20295, partial [Pyrinomonadaceae bacterium]